MTPQAQAIALLTVSLGRKASVGAKPLSNGEWGRFAHWLKSHGKDPAALLGGDADALLADMRDKTISLERIRALLGRGVALGLALEKWQRCGLWLLTRADPEYPVRLKQRFRRQSPPEQAAAGLSSEQEAPPPPSRSRQQKLPL